MSLTSAPVTVPDYPAELVAGVGALDDATRSDLERYIAALAAAREFPLHPVVLWNSLYYRFDPHNRSYSEPPDDLVTVAHDTAMAALPVGAFVKVEAGRDEFWGEIVAKEGRDRAIDSDWVAPRCSGAPMTLSADETGATVAIVREALVIDFYAIVAPVAQHLERQRERGRVIDGRHHVVVDAIYDPADAEIDDATYFARWMVREHRHELVTGVFGAGLEPSVLADDEQLLGALVAAVASLWELATGVAECRQVGSYLFDQSSYDARLAEPDVPLGRADLEHLATSLATVPRGESESYVALGLRLDAMVGDDAELHGPGWLRACCHATAYVLDILAERAPDGVLDTPAGPVHLRIDDAWQHGGVWRTAALVGGWDPVCAIAPDVALGLGFAQSEGPVPTEIASDDGDLELTLVSPTELGGAVVLSAGDVAGGRLRLDRRLLEDLSQCVARAGTDLVVRLAVEGFELDTLDRTHLVRFSDSGGVQALLGVAWPWPFICGARPTVRWQRSSTVLDVVLRRRAEPFTFGVHSFDFECDERLLARALGAPAPPAAPRGRTLRDLVLEALKRRGEPAASGGRRADLARVVFAVYGPACEGPARRAVWSQLEALVADGTLERDGEAYRWTPDPNRAPRVVDLTLLRAYSSQMARYVREHEVGLHLRRLAVSERATDERRRLYRVEYEAAGRPPWLPAELPPRYTFVVAHRRARGHG